MANVCSVIVNFCLLFSILLFITNAKEIPNNDNYHSYNVDGDILSSLNQYVVQYREKRDTDTQIAPVVNSSNAPTLSPSSTINQKLLPKEATIAPQLLGINGTGQRKDYSIPKTTLLSDARPNLQHGIADSSSVPSPAMSSSDAKTKAYVTSSPSEQAADEDAFVDKIDESDERNKTINDTAAKDLINKEENWSYYNSTVGVDEKKAKQLWDSFQNFTVSALLSKSHRRAITVLLSFDFPFYGHSIRNITVASGGFLYTGEYVHSWLAATQYIAPLMANFDTSMANDSVVRYLDNGTAFTVVWEKVPLQDRPERGPFTFSVTLHDTGDITFVYHSLPMRVELIDDNNHPVKIGLSDAYIIDKTIFFARRKTIYEYHRVNIGSDEIKNSTIISFIALPTCIQFHDCQSCITNTSHRFTCAWCGTLNRCSTGTDRRRQEWIQKGCDRSQITAADKCAAIGANGNNYDSQQTIVPSSAVNNNDNDRWNHDGDNAAHGNSKEPEVMIKHAQPLADANSSNGAQNGGVGFVAGLLFPCVVVMCLVLWIFYAYRNPHTKSGQLLIQYRPSQWSWRRGEARYTAATIHM